MMRLFFIYIFFTFSVFANEDPMILLPWGIGFILAIGIFFWGIFKAIKTQKALYMLAILPILFFIIGIFFI